jgi:hypothetical protein
MDKPFGYEPNIVRSNRTGKTKFADSNGFEPLAFPLTADCSTSELKVR